jgi:4'-phosphopantetheinyl transferase EntD
MRDRAALDGLFPDSVVTELVTTADALSPLFPAEEVAVARAVPKRRWEFSAGRHGARQALGALGVAPGPLPSGPDRVPIWPEGVVGSISHADDCCVVAVARKGPVRAIGIDVELADPLARVLWEPVCGPAEVARLRRVDEAQRGVRAKLFFSAKECFYKCQYTFSRTFLDFHDAEVDTDSYVAASGRFRVRFLRAAGEAFAAGDILEGRYLLTDGHVLTAMALPLSPLSPRRWPS